MHPSFSNAQCQKQIVLGRFYQCVANYVNQKHAHISVGLQVPIHLDSGYSYNPDLLLWQGENFSPVIIATVEVVRSHGRSEKIDLAKQFSKQYSGEIECFIFDFTETKFHKVVRKAKYCKVEEGDLISIINARFSEML